jgi:serine/threonine protein phosphatase PrpC
VTADHKPTVRSETRRIMLAGGELRAIRYPDGSDGPVRVWLRGRDVPGLAMSRSIGDESGKMAGVSSEPDIARAVLGGKDAVLVVASDGLWEFLSVEEVAAIVHGAYRHARVAADAGGALAAAIDQLVTESTHRWFEREGCVDDMSILIAEIHAAADDAEHETADLPA